MSHTVLIVAPRSVLAELTEWLKGFEVVGVPQDTDALIALEQVEPQAVVLEVSDAAGLELLAAAKRRLPVASFLAVAGDTRLLTAALQAGADAGLERPTSEETLRVLLQRTLDRAQFTVDAVRYRRRAEWTLEGTSVQELVGSHPAMQQLLKRAAQVAQSRSTVLINGESGTGKELVAAAIHHNSKRGEGPLVRLNCAALSETVLESELFGHERGAFTGALTRREGRFKQADGGSLFLDEVGEIPAKVQVKLLRFLQEREFERVGSNDSIKVDVRILAATNRDLRALVEEGRFREDLYYRLSVVHLAVPPLRARPSDVLLLADHFLRVLAEENGEPMDGFSDAARQLLLDYPWPGNVRELKNCVEQAFVFAEHSVIDIGDLPLEPPPKEAAIRLMVPGVTMAELERYAIVETLKAVDGSTVRAASILGISQRTIQYRLKEWGLASAERKTGPMQ